MTRLKKAWLALCGELEPREVFSDCVVVKAYRITDWNYHFGGGMVRSYPGARRYYETCTQAYATEPGRRVDEVNVLKAGGQLFVLSDKAWMREIQLQPKPKIAKGKRK
jgi:hypothetical protein